MKKSSLSIVCFASLALAFGASVSFGEVYDVDFSGVTTLSPYGRFRGDNAQPEPGKTYPSLALDRQGSWTATRFGTSGQFQRFPNIKLEQGKPFAIETWVRIYSDKPEGFILDAGFGFKTGFRLVTIHAKYAGAGWIQLICGDGTGSKGVSAKNGGVDAWHHVVVTMDGETPVLYVDGVRADADRPEQRPVKYVFGGPTPLTVGSRRGTPDMKFDGFKVHDRAMTLEEAKARYEKGMAPPRDDLEELLGQIRLEIPKESQGYFKVGERIPVTVSVPPQVKADAVVVNGRRHRLGKKIALSFDKPDVTEITIELKSAGKTIRRAVYPIAIIPPPKDGSLVGFNSIATRTPAAFALGARLSREAVTWASLEPKKGEYDWLAMDRFMKWNQARGIDVVLCLKGVPGWARLPEDEWRRQKILKILRSRYDLNLFEDDAAKPPYATAGGTQQRVPGESGATWIREEKESAACDIRAMVGAFADGAKNWFAGSGPDEYQPRPNAADGRPGWKGVAYGVFNAFVGRGATLTREQPHWALEIVRYRNRDGSKGLIVFTKKGEVKIKASVDAVGLFGEKLGRGEISVGTVPVYLPGEKAIAF